MRLLETALWIVGTTLIAFYIAANAWGNAQAQRHVSGFAGAQQIARGLADVNEQRDTFERPASNVVEVAARPALAVADIAVTENTVVAVLRIPGIALEVPVMYGTGEGVLRRGAGVIEGTRMPGTQGNVALAAHRDTFFRGLKDIALGDQIELETFDRTLHYRITELSVVEPTAVHVLADTAESVLTLVTCYPFYFVGNAPQRFIVRAEVANPTKP